MKNPYNLMKQAFPKVTGFYNPSASFTFFLQEIGMPFLSSIPSGIIAYRKTTCVAVLAQAHPHQYSLEVLHGWKIGVDSLLDYTARPHCFLALMACNDVSNLQPTSREQGGGEKDADFEEDAADDVNTGESDAKDHVETSVLTLGTYSM